MEAFWREPVLEIRLRGSEKGKKTQKFPIKKKACLAKKKKNNSSDWSVRTSYYLRDPEVESGVCGLLRITRWASSPNLPQIIVEMMLFGK